MPYLVSIGDLVVDLIAPARLPILPNQHQETRGFRLEPGGGGSTVIMAVRLGIDVHAVGAVGDDLFGRQLIAWLREEGVRVGQIWQPASSSSTVVLDLIDTQMREHVFVGSHGEGEIAPWQPIEPGMRGAAAIFFQGYTLLEAQNTALVHGAFEVAASTQTPLCFDVGPPSAHADPAYLHAALTHAHTVFATEDELPIAALGRTGEQAERYLLDLGARRIVVKMGAAGCRVVERAGTQHCPGFAVEVADTVGAGDCFDAGFLYGMAHGWPTGRAARLANACGAAACRKQGAGRNVPTRGEVLALFEEAL